MVLRVTLVALALLAVYVAVGLAVQRSMLYPRPPVPPQPPPLAELGIEAMRLPPDDVEAWFLPPRGAGGPAPAVIFTHGNGELIDYWPEEMARLAGWGVGVLLVEYPGYGRSGGRPAQRSITRALIAAYDRLAGRADVDRSRIVAWGRSLGGGAACALAAERPLGGLVLESSFTGVRPLAQRLGLAGPLVLDPFDNLAVVSRFEGPVLVLHGERDGIIPAAHGERLAAAAPEAELHLLPCGHNDCPRPWPLVRAFLARRGWL